ncbi:MAG: TIGR00725 family protein [Candidatus Omnitrophota bacterium]
MNPVRNLSNRERLSKKERVGMKGISNGAKKQPIIAVIGGNKCSNKVEQLAHKIGKIVAKVGAILVCGGLGGVMEASCKGAKSEKGLTIGILPSQEKTSANSFVDIALPTGLGYSRNVLVVKSADIVIAIDGKYGTLSEIAYALHFKKPTFGIGTWNIKGVIKIASLIDLENRIRKIIKNL